jgi:hypothetical protein
VQCPVEEPAGCRQILLRRGQDVDGLPVLVDRPVQVRSLPSNQFVDETCRLGRAASINCAVNRCTHR